MARRGSKRSSGSRAPRRSWVTVAAAEVADEVDQATSKVSVKVASERAMSLEEFNELASVLASNKEEFGGLDLAGHQLGEEERKVLFKALRSNTTLTELSLESTGLGAKGVDELCAVLAEDNATLKVLNLYNNGIGDDAAEAFKDMLKKNNTLVKLDLRNNILGPKTGRFIAEALENKTEGLAELDLWNNSIGDEGATALARVLSSNTRFRSLNLFFNSITHSGGCAVASALSKNTVLEELDLGRNTLGKAAGIQLAKSLDKNSANKLRKLSLFGSEIGDEGAKPIMQAVLDGKLRRLVELNLGRNNLTQSVCDLAAKLVCESELKVLNIGRNKLNRGLAKIADALSKPGMCLEKLVLVANAGQTKDDEERNGKFSPIEKAEIGTKFMDAVSSYSTLVELDVSNNQFGGECEKLILKLLSIKSEAKDLDAVFSAKGFDVVFSAVFDAERCKAGSPENPNKSSAERPSGITKLMWCDGAFRMAKQNMFLFVKCLNKVHNKLVDDAITTAKETLMEEGEDPEDDAAVGEYVEHCVGELWSDEETWLQRDPASKLPMLHLLFQQKAAGKELKTFLDDGHTVSVEVMLKLLNAQDDNKRTARSAALRHEDEGMQLWAASYGTYLSRYQIDDGPPVHVSQSCVVCFATDVVAASDSTSADEARVALKIMRGKSDFERELKSRGIRINAEDQNKIVETFQQTEFEHTLRLRGVHQAEKCLIMKRADRSLFETMHAERIAGHDIPRVRDIVLFLSKALLELKKKGLVHGDIKPRNILRDSKESASDYFDWGKASNTSGGKKNTSKRFMRWAEPTDGAADGESVDGTETWKLIDLDATVPVGELLSEKCSSGYVPPELAKQLYAAETSDRSRPKADPSFDVWSFGVVLYELLSGTPLFLMDKTNDNIVSPYDKAELVNWLVIDQDRLSRIQTDSEGSGKLLRDAKNLVQRCLVGDPLNRISIDDVCSHPFITSADDARREARQARMANMKGQVSVLSLRGRRSRGSSIMMAALEEPGDTTGKVAASTRDAQRASSAAAGPKRTSAMSRLAKAGAKLASGLRGKSASKKQVPEPPSQKKSRKSSSRGQAESVSTSQLALVERDLGAGNPYEAVELEQHFFFSHAQKEASAIVKDLFLNCRENRCSSWLDVLAPDLTASGMKRGIEKSKVFVFVLTRTVLFRPFCIKELFWAVEANKEVICVYETDERFFKYFGAALPWLSESEVEAELASRISDKTVLEKTLDDLKFNENREALVKGIGGEAELAKYLGPISKKFASFPMLPYRRRAFESKAMVDEILRLADIESPSALRERSSNQASSTDVDRRNGGLKKRAARREALSVVIVCASTKQGSTIARQLEESMRLYETFHYNEVDFICSPVVDEGGAKLAELSMSDCDNDNTVVLFLVTNGVFDNSPDMAEGLRNWWIKNRGRVACVYEEWMFGGKEELALKKEYETLYTKLFMDSELLPMRRSRDPLAKGDLIHVHEHVALIRELQKRLVAEGGFRRAPAHAVR